MWKRQAKSAARGVFVPAILTTVPVWAEEPRETSSLEASSASSEEDSEDESRTTLGMRGFAGILLEEHEVLPVFGGGLVLGYAAWKHLELEGSLVLAEKHEPPPFLIAEVITKWVLEREGAVSTHLTLGPIFSADFTQPIELSAGLLAGGGVTWWTHPTIGWTADLNYRLLLGAEVAHAVTLGLGVALKGF